MTTGDQALGRVVLVMHTTSYNVEAFVAACDKAGVQAIIASDRCFVLDGVWQWPGDSVAVDFHDAGAAAAAIAAHAASLGAPTVRAVIPVGGEAAAVVATLAAQRIGLRGNAPGAAQAAANKLRMRELCAAATDAAAPVAVVDAVVSERVCVPRFRAFAMEADPELVAVQVGLTVGFPCVLKPLLLSGSRGVMRADDRAAFVVAFLRLRKLLSTPALLHITDGDGDGDGDAAAARQVLVESFVSGPEVALEGLLTDGKLRGLALFDKPDPLDGPFFEETIYVTPSRHPRATQLAAHAAVQAAARAIGLVTGPVHAEVRLGADGPVVIEVAARSIGGLCSRTLRFGTGLSLEDLLIRHAIGDLGGDEAEHDTNGGASMTTSTSTSASGVMMIPIPAAGVLKEVAGIGGARGVSLIEDVVISARVGETLVPLPEGASYLGFIFARGPSPEVVEAALRAAHGHLTFAIAPRLAIA